MTRRRLKKARKAQERALYRRNAAEMPTAELTAADLKGRYSDILDLLVKSGLVASRSGSRRAVEQGGVSMDGEKVTETSRLFCRRRFPRGRKDPETRQEKLQTYCCKISLISAGFQSCFSHIHSLPLHIFGNS